MEIIHRILGGSHLYGTARPDSDEDVRGVCLMPRNALLGLQNFEQYQVQDEKQDVEIYGINKFCELALANNPNVLDLLFASQTSWQVQTTQWQQIYAIRHAFLSQRIRKTFAGYAYGQMKAMQTHYAWLKDAPTKPRLEDYNGKLHNAENGAQKLVFTYQSNEVAYQRALTNYNNYHAWHANRNPKRAEIERRVGYDVKSGAHLLRLSLKALDILASCDYNPTLTDNQLARVIAVLNGHVSYDNLLHDSQLLLDQITSVNSTLPKSANFERVEEVLMDINWQSLRS